MGLAGGDTWGTLTYGSCVCFVAFVVLFVQADHHGYIGTR